MSLAHLLVTVAVLSQAVYASGDTEDTTTRMVVGEPPPPPSRFMVDTRKQDHPFLYYTSSEIMKLRDQVRSTHKALYVRLTHFVETMKMKEPPADWNEFVARWNEIHGNNLAILALYCALTPHDHVAQKRAKLFMHRLAGYPTWFVKGKETDFVPVSHTLLGFTTAFDLLYDSFTQTERNKYLKKLHAIGKLFYDRSLNQFHWGANYIHNHVPTNYVSLLACAITIKSYYPKEATIWITRSVKALDKTMTFLKMVVDGSMNEGVSYGTYTMRSLVRFIYFTQRHMNRTYHTNNWLKEHFHFLLHTLLPGYQRTFGIADSVQDWAFSPEGELMFLEGYVHLNGTSVWLANQIAEQRTAKRTKKIKKIMHFCITLEFLYYNHTVRATPVQQPRLHVFSDLGVLTYGGGTPAGGAYLSFKCGRLHGRSVNMIRPNLKPGVQHGFRPGHEQPDQGSFVFVTKKQSVVTEAFYAPKFTFLENTLMFGTSREPSRPARSQKRLLRGLLSSQDIGVEWSGQIGEGDLWLDFSRKDSWLARGEIVGYSTHGRDLVFMSGDMTSWYHRSLGLSTVYRVLLMLTPSVLVVVDTVHVHESSPTTHVSNFFHNVDVPFKIRGDEGGSRGLPCAGIGLYSVCWTHHNSHTVDATTVNNYRMERARYATNMINVTWQLLASSASTAYVFHGPRDNLYDVTLTQTALADGIKVSVHLNATRYDIVLATDHWDPRYRRALLGSSGYGKLCINRSVEIDLGVSGGSRDATFSATKPGGQLISREGDHHTIFYAPLASFLVLAGLCIQSRKGRRSQRVIRFTMFILFVVVFATMILYHRENPQVFQLKRSAATPLTTSFESTRNSKQQKHIDMVIVNELPLSGGEIARELFMTNTDFVVVTVPSRAVVIPSGTEIFKTKLNFAAWSDESEKRTFAKWWEKLIRAPTLIKKHGAIERVSLSDPISPSKRYSTNVTKSHGALPMVHFKNPGWIFQTGWLDSILPGDYLAPMLYLVRDPRSWIEHLLSQNGPGESFLRDLKNALLTKGGVLKLPAAIARLRDIYKLSMPEHVLCAHVWRAFVSHALELRTSLSLGRFRIVRFEDMVTSPKESARNTFRFLRMPFSAAVEHRILLVVKSGVFSLKEYGIIGRESTSWGKFLTKEQVLEIEQICRKTMIKLGY